MSSETELADPEIRWVNVGLFLIVITAIVGSWVMYVRAPAHPHSSTLEPERERQVMLRENAK